jgi:sigma-B regulation protein RsbU (phosphoserine phosphatase)
MMMAAHEVLHSLALVHSDPEDLLRIANARLHSLRRRGDGIRGGSFVALGYLSFAPSSGTLRYSLAGQPPPMICRSTGQVEELALPDHRLPLGALSFGGHQVLNASLDPGELLMAYSDGVVDAQSPHGDFFGEDRLSAALQECPREPQAAVNWILEALEAFTQGHVPYDDVTLVAARWVG